MLKSSFIKNIFTTNTLRTINLSSIMYNIPKMPVVSKDKVLKSKLLDLIIFKVKEKFTSNEAFSVKFYEEVVNLFPRTNSGSVTMNKELFYKGLNE
jgi:hypothetical protein